MAAKRMLAVPTAGLRVPFPGRATPLAPEGEPVVADNYWHRRAMHGECALVEIDAAKAPDESPEDSAPSAATEEPRSKRQKDSR